MTAAGFELGLDSFGEVATDAGRVLSDTQTVPLIVAESVGLDVFGVGEHYRADVNDSAPPVLLAAIAAAERIRLGTSVTVLGTNDPVRLHHRFSTLDAVSNGRARSVPGGAWSSTSSGCSGTTRADDERLFEEKLDLVRRLQTEDAVSWSGTVRGPLDGRRLHRRIRPGRPTDLDRGGRQPELDAPRRAPGAGV